MVTHSTITWTLLAYRVPREPSAPRIAIWRKLKRLGVAQVGDGLVALPADARTTEALEWVADQVLAAGGTATIWAAHLPSRSAQRELVDAMALARAAEYVDLATRAVAAHDSLSELTSLEQARRLRLLRRELRQIQRRDHFPPTERQHTQQVVRDLAAAVRQADPLIEVAAE